MYENLNLQNPATRYFANMFLILETFLKSKSSFKLKSLGYYTSRVSIWLIIWLLHLIPFLCFGFSSFYKDRAYENCHKIYEKTMEYYS